MAEAKKGNTALGCFTLIVILISVVTIISMCSSGTFIINDCKEKYTK